MRLIDADAFLVDQLRKARANETDWQIAYWTGVDDTLGDIADAPTIDAVAVVRCKDCKRFAYDKSDADYYCTISACVVAHNDFCSYGERKDGDG